MPGLREKEYRRRMTVTDTDAIPRRANCDRIISQPRQTSFLFYHLTRRIFSAISRLISLVCQSVEMYS